MDSSPLSVIASIAESDKDAVSNSSEETSLPAPLSRRKRLMMPRELTYFLSPCRADSSRIAVWAAYSSRCGAWLWIS